MPIVISLWHIQDLFLQAHVVSLVALKSHRALRIVSTLLIGTYADTVATRQVKLLKAMFINGLHAHTLWTL